MPTSSYRRILETLDRHGVEYIVVGGVAAVLQGAPMTTFDIDTLIKVDAVNATKVLNECVGECDETIRRQLEDARRRLLELR